MRELNGLELASFKSRAIALLIDFVIAGALSLGGLVGFFKIRTNRRTVHDRKAETIVIREKRS